MLETPDEFRSLFQWQLLNNVPVTINVCYDTYSVVHSKQFVLCNKALFVVVIFVSCLCCVVIMHRKIKSKKQIPPRVFVHYKMCRKINCAVFVLFIQQLPSKFKANVIMYVCMNYSWFPSLDLHHLINTVNLSCAMKYLCSLHKTNSVWFKQISDMKPNKDLSALAIPIFKYTQFKCTICNIFNKVANATSNPYEET